MALVSDVLDWLRSLPPAALLAGAGALVFGETTLGLGFVAPGETGLFILGTTATSAWRFLLMWLVTTLCAVAGYSVGYLIGRKLGPRLRRTKVVRRHGDGWDRALDQLRRRGAWAVFVGIFLPVLRTLMPAAAGASRLPYRKFLPVAFLGGAAWCALHIGIGAAAGEAARQLENAVGVGSWIVLALVVLVAGSVYLVRRRRARH
ncbi:membrane protein DedA with SNARE-associated domain [Prauserella shujinwangii]|uniref:Membrane protein DedA with SNARE-associated domain n=1 Tax=Prauserella shujinwangii TaxID=1453103 RepID=A0A2T0M0R9_9PSEU|nr:DedA family protein [Prauserella shujinwangii]PRX50157.1 membrane protein DedA with SNARE-associated domain [Prauserella shujinwangii]